MLQLQEHVQLPLCLAEDSGGIHISCIAGVCFRNVQLHLRKNLRIKLIGEQKILHCGRCRGCIFSVVAGIVPSAGNIEGLRIGVIPIRPLLDSDVIGMQILSGKVAGVFLLQINPLSLIIIVLGQIRKQIGVSIALDGEVHGIDGIRVQIFLYIPWRTHSGIQSGIGNMDVVGARRGQLVKLDDMHRFSGEHVLLLCRRERAGQSDFASARIDDLVSLSVQRTKLAEIADSGRFDGIRLISRLIDLDKGILPLVIGGTDGHVLKRERCAGGNSANVNIPEVFQTESGIVIGIHQFLDRQGIGFPSRSGGEAGCRIQVVPADAHDIVMPLGHQSHTERTLPCSVAAHLKIQRTVGVIIPNAHRRPAGIWGQICSAPAQRRPGVRTAVVH